MNSPITQQISELAASLGLKLDTSTSNCSRCIMIHKSEKLCDACSEIHTNIFKCDDEPINASSEELIDNLYNGLMAISAMADVHQ